MSIIDDLGLPAAGEPLLRPIIDNHTHVFTTQQSSGLPVAHNLDLCTSVGVKAIVEVGCDVESSRQAVELAAHDDRVVAAVAIHPNDIGQLWLDGGIDAVEQQLAQLEPLVSQQRVRAVGETGLDYFRTRDDQARRAQTVSFERHIQWAKTYNRTLMIHDRDAHHDVLKVLDEVGAPDRVILHCFSGDAEFARRCIERGYFLSFSGVVTFGSAESLREAAKVTPIEHILVETDAPFLTPKPCRGKPNAAYLLPHTVRFLADLLGWGVPEFCDAVVANTHRAYGGPWGGL